MPITSSVGSGGVNRHADVRRVQDYLNVARSQDGLPPIAVDGIVGPETIGAITAFQRGNTRVIDGRVDPHGPTIATLERIVATVVETNLRKDMLQVLDDLDEQLARKG
jgi:peptidoglycan hydrolase-like protein with peptidoglycan-binding domain